MEFSTGRRVGEIKARRPPALRVGPRLNLLRSATDATNFSPIFIQTCVYALLYYQNGLTKSPILVVVI